MHLPRKRPRQGTGEKLERSADEARTANGCRDGAGVHRSDAALNPELAQLKDIALGVACVACAETWTLPPIRIDLPA